MKEYIKLDKSMNYDIDAVRELATAANELAIIEQRAHYLRKLCSDNEELSRYLHKAKEGKYTAIRDLEDDHLSNLLAYLVREGKEVSLELQGEARKRNVVIPRGLLLELPEDLDDFGEDPPDFDN